MYGMINKAMEEMVVKHHGEKAWSRIKREAKLEVESFISTDPYDDQITYDLVGAASRVLGVAVDDLLVGFGEHWILVTASEGYGGLMHAAGTTFIEFLEHLPHFHDRVRMVFPYLSPPRFELNNVDAERGFLELHYFSHRPGLAYFVVGLMQGLGKMFGTPVRVTHVEMRKSAEDHDVFRVEWDPAIKE